MNGFRGPRDRSRSVLALSKFAKLPRMTADSHFLPVRLHGYWHEAEWAVFLVVLEVHIEGGA